jgi:hypothetical protein
MPYICPLPKAWNINSSGWNYHSLIWNANSKGRNEATFADKTTTLSCGIQNYYAKNGRKCRKRQKTIGKNAKH